MNQVLEGRMDRIDHLSKRLDYLRKIDKDRVVFGAEGGADGGHGYERRPWTNKDILNFEKEIGDQIPEELREWLLRVGEGPSPCYGLTLYDASDWKCRDPEKLTGEFQNFVDVTLADIQSLIDTAHEKGPAGPRRMPPEVTIISEGGGPHILGLGDAGCSYDFVMPLRGELRGRVFYRTYETLDPDDLEIEYGSVLWPEGLVHAVPHPRFDRAEFLYEKSAQQISGFLDWIDDWLTQATYFVKHHRKFRRQLRRRQEEYHREYTGKSSNKWEAWKRLLLR